MSRITTIRRRSVLGAAMALAAPTIVRAQSYPARSVRVVNAYQLTLAAGLIPFAALGDVLAAG